MYRGISLEDRVALVFGGTGEIGEAICLKLASFGANIIIVYKKHYEKANTIVEKVTSMSRRSKSIKADVTVVSDLKNVITSTLNEFLTIDIMVNCVGISPAAVPVVELDEDIWDYIIDVNLKGSFLCCKAVAKEMIKKRKGRIINISSIFGIRSPALRGAYGASKHGLIGLTQTLAKELGPYNITVNSICPGPVETEMVKDIYTKSAKTLGISFEEYYSRVVSAIPLGRLADVNEIANTVVFIASDMASHITGSAIEIAGGAT